MGREDGYDSRMSDAADPVVELEVRVSYQEKIIEDLDEVVRDFARRVEALERKVVELQERLTEDSPEVGEQDVPPPHY